MLHVFQLMFCYQASDGEKLKENQSRVIKYAEMFFFRLMGSQANIPFVFKHLAQTLQLAVKDRPEVLKYIC
jgi:hypothetical protein